MHLCHIIEWRFAKKREEILVIATPAMQINDHISKRFENIPKCQRKSCGLFFHAMDMEKMGEETYARFYESRGSEF